MTGDCEQNAEWSRDRSSMAESEELNHLCQHASVVKPIQT